MSYLIKPVGYKALLNLPQTEMGIKKIKDFFFILALKKRNYSVKIEGKNRNYSVKTRGKNRNYSEEYNSKERGCQSRSFISLLT